MDSVGVVQRLIFDVGAHEGEDSAFYLSRGFDVVAVEANPILVEKLLDRFRDEISAGRFTLAIVNKMRARQGELERPLREWPRWHDEFVRSGYFARSVDKIREDVEYLYAFVRKKVSLGQDIQEGLELLQKRRDIDADIDRLKKELEEMEKTGKQQDKGGAE